MTYANKVDIARLRDTDPAVVLQIRYGATLALHSKDEHKTRSFNLPSGTKIGVTPARHGGFVWTIQGSGHGGRGCVNLVMEIEQCDARQAVSILSEGMNLAAPQSVRRPASPVSGVGTPVTVAPAVPEFWGKVRRWLIEARGLPPKLVDCMHANGKVWADDRRNAVFPRVAGGAFVRGTCTAEFRRTIGGKKCGPFVIPGEQHVVICESPIDSMSVKSMAPHVHAIAIGGSLLSAQDLMTHLPDGPRALVLAFDNDAAGRKYTALSQLVWPTARVRIPDTGKDWNDTVRAEPWRISAAWR